MKRLLCWCRCFAAVVLLMSHGVVGFSTTVVETRRTTFPHQQRENLILLAKAPANNNHEVDDFSRRQLVPHVTMTAAALLLVALTPSPAAAETITPDQAFDNLIAGRDELIEAAQKYLAKADWDGLTEYLQDEDRQINKYEANAQVLLTSKRLDVESKKAIGTIRRYGVGADVLIMYGGLRSELESPMGATPNMSAVQSYMVKTLDSLEEVIVICRSNGFDEKRK